MSYSHFIESDLITLTDFKRFCYDHNLPLDGHGAVELAKENYGVYAELIYRNGPTLQIIAGPKVSERFGLLEVARQLRPLPQHPHARALPSNSPRSFERTVLTTKS